MNRPTGGAITDERDPHVKSDAQLLASSGHDPQAFRQLYDRYAEAIHAFFLRRTSDREGALDLTAETFAQVWTSRHRFVDQKDGSAGPWLFGVARNVLSRAARERRMISEAVEQGMPGSSVIFIDTDPTCAKKSDVEFDCTLAKAPSKEILDDYTGTKETFNDADDNIAGGCIGQDSAGLHWTCYAGEKAVEMDIIGPDLLGQHTNGPAAG